MSLRIGDLEIRTCNEQLLRDGPHVTVDFMRWTADGTCYSIAYWRKHKDGFDLRFVGDRPFIQIQPDTFWKLAKFGQEFLEEEFHSDA